MAKNMDSSNRRGVLTSNNEEEGSAVGNGHDCQQGRRRLRRPLHSNYRTGAASITCSLLLLSTSPSSSTAAATVIDNESTIPTSHLRQRSLATSSKYCPASYTGKAPTARCAGYVDCLNGKQSSSTQSCASGTAFDIKSGTCTWPDRVTCKVGNDLLSQVGGDGGKEEVKDKEEEPSKFCPPNYTGRAPTTNCRGYVQCTRGTEVLSVKCPPRTNFNIMTSLCEYNLDDEECTLLVGGTSTTNEDDEDEGANNVGVNELNQYCPPNYTGRAPTHRCTGYVDCKNGVAKRSKSCPGETKFDIMILACTYNDSGCNALHDDDGEQTMAMLLADGSSTGGVVPTVSPTTKRQGRINDLITGCPTEHYTGYVTLPGCTTYIYCSSGKELNKLSCPVGTLFNGNICTWPDQVTCDTTSIPTLSPSGHPTYVPTGLPTYTPTSLDISDLRTIWYPNFTQGVCRNDGNFPSTVGHQYLFTQSSNCCETYFTNNLDECLKATIPSPSPTPLGGKQWYPDYAHSICLNDENYSPHEVNFFYTYEECCTFDWISDTIKCLRNSQPIGIGGGMYYPDYNSNTCKNDGKQSMYEYNLFDTKEECCRFDWIDYGICITDDGGGSINQNQGSDAGGGGGSSVGTGTVVEPIMGYEYYPDYKHNVCHCDGRQSKFEVNIFSSYEKCCQFSLIDANICRQYQTFQEEKCIKKQGSSGETTGTTTVVGTTSSNNPDFVWYADLSNGLCRDDGKKQPQGSVIMMPTHELCCKRFIPQDTKHCIAKSESFSKKNLGGDGTGGGGSVPSKSDHSHCYELKPRGCVKDLRCHYDREWKKCYGATEGKKEEQQQGTTTTVQQQQQAPSTPAPTPRPIQPTPPATTVNNDVCSGNTKKQCMKDSTRCDYDPDLDRCFMLTTGAQQQPQQGQQQQVIDNTAPAMTSFGDAITEEDNTATSNNNNNNGGTSSNNNKYYPDFFHSICLNDGKQVGGDQYDNVKDCCENPWIDYKTCMKHASGKRTIESVDRVGGNGMPMNKPEAADEEPTTNVSGGNIPLPYYPDYFYNLCRNDGRQSELEDNLFDTMEECCRGVSYIDTDSCMSNA